MIRIPLVAVAVVFLAAGCGGGDGKAKDKAPERALKTEATLLREQEEASATLYDATTAVGTCVDTDGLDARAACLDVRLQDAQKARKGVATAWSALSAVTSGECRDQWRIAESALARIEDREDGLSEAIASDAMDAGTTEAVVAQTAMLEAVSGLINANTAAIEARNSSVEVCEAQD